MNERKGRVLVLATTFPRWRGDSEPPFVWELTHQLTLRGFQCTVLVPHAKGASQREEWDGVEIRRFRYAPDTYETVCYDGGALPNLRASWKARLALPSLLYVQRRTIRELLRNEAFDLVHSHWIIPQGYWAASACRSVGIPLLLTAHAGDVFGLPPLLKRAAKRALGGGAAVTANSRATAEAIREIEPSIEPLIIPMGVDTARFAYTDNGEAKHLGGDPALLAVGRFAEKKGLHTLIKAMPKILEHLPRCRLHLVGFGPWEKRLRSLVKEKGLEHCVDIHGAVSHEKIATLFLGADIFVQPSLPDTSGDREGLGVTILEAMAASVPVVASRSGGILDVIEDEVHGLLANPGNISDLAGTVVRIWRHERRDQMVQNAKDRVTNRFSWNSVADRFADLYADLIQGGGRQRENSAG